MTHGGKFMILHSEHKIKRHIKIIGTKSPYNSDWEYWTTRLGKMPGIKPKLAKLMKCNKVDVENVNYSLILIML